MNEILTNGEQYLGENKYLLQTHDEQYEVKPNYLKSDALDRYLAEKAELFKSMGLLRLYNREWYMFNGLTYQFLSEDIFNSFAFQSAMNDNVILKAGHCKKLLYETKIRTFESLNAPNDENYTVFANGLFSNFDGSQLQMIPSDYFATISVNGCYLQNAPISHPITDEFLYTISGGDPELIERHWEFWGYVLSSDAHAKAIFLLYGASGNNGKSTELALITNLLSPGSVDNMPINTLLSRFGINRMRNRRFECSGDEGELNINPYKAALLKSFSGNDGITADVKNKEMVQFKCTCKIAISSNYNIGMAYSAVDPALARRMVTIPYPVSIPREKQDPNIMDKLLGESNAIVTDAFNHYLKVKNNNYKFTGSERFDAEPSILFSPISPEYNAIRTFSENCCDFSDPTAFTSTDNLYQKFISMYGHMFKDITGFSQAFNRVNSEKIQKTRQHSSNQNIRGFNGVRLTL